MGKGGEGGGHDLEEAEEFLRIVVELLRQVVHLLDLRVVRLVVGDLSVDALPELVLHAPKKGPFGGPVLHVGLHLFVGDIRALGVLLDDGGPLWDAPVVEHLVGAKGLLALDLAVGPRDEEDDAESARGEADGDALDGDFPRLLVVEVKAGGALPDDEEGFDGGGEGEDKGDGANGPLVRVRAAEEAVLDEKEDGGGTSTGDQGSVDPAGRDEPDAFVGVGPVDRFGAVGGDAEADDGADGGVGGGDGEAELGGADDTDGGAVEGAEHAEHEGGWVVGVVTGLHDLVLDGVGDMRAEEEGA
mmetsp:Transcript_21862/g.54003  ORF Transcript_21862/g.54003 Transcript_21862/m.54003 type:complete len:301 (+) Transcript_21862:646-1548(+)